MIYRNLEKEISIISNIRGSSTAVGFGRAGTTKDVSYVPVANECKSYFERGGEKEGYIYTKKRDT